MIAPARPIDYYLGDVPRISAGLRTLAQFDADVVDDDLGPDCLNAVDLSEPAEPSPRVRRLIAAEIRDGRLEVSVTEVTGKFKVSQNRPVSDREGVAGGLERQGGEANLAMARLALMPRSIRS